MKNPSSFTVCIPTYNRSETISWTVESILQQSLREFDLIILDDSRDHLTESVINQYVRGDTRVHYQKNTERMGIVGNWNNCIDHCASPFLLILHHDDLLCKDTLLKYKEFFGVHKDCGLVHSNSLDVDLTSGKIRQRVTQEKEVLSWGNEAVLKILLNNNTACSTVAVRKECYERHGKFLEHLWVSPDWEMWARLGRSYSIGHFNDIGAVIVVDGRNTHLLGIPPNEFFRQQEEYVKRILNYVDADKEMLDELEVKSNSMLTKMMERYCVLYLRAGRFDIAWQYYRYVRERMQIGRGLVLGVDGLLRFVHSKLREMKSRRKLDYAELFRELL